jgi:hypothetical protein
MEHAETLKDRELSERIPVGWKMQNGQAENDSAIKRQIFEKVRRRLAQLRVEEAVAVPLCARNKQGAQA